MHEIRGTLAFMSSAITDALPFGNVWVAYTDGKVAAAAVWLPPEGYPRSRGRDLMTIVRTLPGFMHAGVRALMGVRLLNESERAHHALGEPHYYLAVLGSDPMFRGAGAASAALAPVLESCDQQGLSAYLETQREENLAYYGRHGFDMVRRIDVKGVPPIWTMLRKPCERGAGLVARP